MGTNISERDKSHLSSPDSLKTRIIIRRIRESITDYNSGGIGEKNKTKKDIQTLRPRHRREKKPDRGLRRVAVTIESERQGRAKKGKSKGAARGAPKKKQRSTTIIRAR